MVGSAGHGNPISPSTSAQLIEEAVKEADIELDKEIQQTSSRFSKIGLSSLRNLRRLGYIAFNKIGTDQGNRFVFSCKYGWIDHGHFFKNAYGTYETSRWITALFAELVELGQTIIGSESAYSPEDKRSNFLGREFGDRMKKYDYAVITQYKVGPNRRVAPSSEFFKISQEWNELLKNAGAIKWNNSVRISGKSVAEWIKGDLERWRNRNNSRIPNTSALTVGGSDQYKKSQPIWKCLCDGDLPRRKELRY